MSGRSRQGPAGRKSQKKDARHSVHSAACPLFRAAAGCGRRGQVRPRTWEAARVPFPQKTALSTGVSGPALPGSHPHRRVFAAAPAGSAQSPGRMDQINCSAAIRSNQPPIDKNISRSARFFKENGHFEHFRGCAHKSWSDLMPQHSPGVFAWRPRPRAKAHTAGRRPARRAGSPARPPRCRRR